MRAFIGIALPDGIRQVLARLQQQLAHARTRVKWVAPSHLHVTLKFLDQITEEQRHTAEDILREIAAHLSPFLLGLGPLGAFPSLRAPRVLWVGCSEGAAQLAQIAQAIERPYRTLRLRQADHPFSSHLTLGRVLSAQSLEGLVQMLRATVWQPPVAWQVTTLILYESRLCATGPHYTALAEVPLGGGG